MPNQMKIYSVDYDLGDGQKTAWFETWDEANRFSVEIEEPESEHLPEIIAHNVAFQKKAIVRFLDSVAGGC